MIDYFHNEVFKSGYVWVDENSELELFMPKTVKWQSKDEKTGRSIMKSSVTTPSPWLIPAVFHPDSDKVAREEERIRYSLPLYRPYPRRGEANGEVPLKAPQPLVRKFTALEAGNTDDEDVQKESILGFANEYGLLGEQVCLLTSDGYPVSCDTLSFWINQIHAVQRVLRLWDLLCLEIWHKEGGASAPYRPTDEPKELRQLFVIGDDYVTYKWQGQMGDRKGLLVIGSEKHPELLEQWQKKHDLVVAARVALAMLLDENLSEFTRGKVLFDTSRTEDLILRVVPNSLIGAVWWELARLVTGELRFKQCEVCGQWEDTTSKRPDWRMHDACRKRAHWKRKRKPIT